MGLYLHIEVDSPLSRLEFHERVILPLGKALEHEKLGRLIEGGPEDVTVEGIYELALEVTDLERARQIVKEVLRSVDD